MIRRCKVLLLRFAAQQAHPADAAARPQDRWRFTISFYAYTRTDLDGGAADGQAVRPLTESQSSTTCCG